MKYDPHCYPFASRRNLLYGRNGAVATSHPEAANLGLSILKKGGNAVDAAVAAAAALAVLEPTSNGLGGDCFALVHDGKTLYGLNASGWSPRNLTASGLVSQGIREIPRYGWESFTVPGALAGWHLLLSRFGSMSPGDLLSPLIDTFSRGVPVPPTIAENWSRACNNYSATLKTGKGQRRGLYESWFRTFAPEGRAPRAGELWRCNDQIRTLNLLKEEGFRSLYEGTLAEALLSYSSKTGGYLEREDLSLYQPEWVEPVSMKYKGVEVWEIPPNGQGIVALMALGMLQNDLFKSFENLEDLHLGIEAIKLSFADAQRYLADSRVMDYKTRDLLDPEYLLERRRLIGPEALDPCPGKPPKGGTVYLATADREGKMVSFIQSNYMGFGSGLVIPGFGVSLHNRGNNFTLEEGHLNRLAGRKRPYHTIIPGFLTENGKPLGPFGVMGGFMQPQGHLQVVMNLVDYGMNPQAALDAPRWQWISDKKVILEPEYKASTLAALNRRGHETSVEINYGHFGRGQIILRQDNGVYVVGTEKRCDGYAAVY